MSRSAAWWGMAMLAAVAPAAGEEQTPFKSQKAQAARHEYLGAVQGARDEFGKQAAAALTDGMEKLDAALEDVMKKGALDEANRIKAQQDRLRELLAASAKGGRVEPDDIEFRSGQARRAHGALMDALLRADQALSRAVIQAAVTYVEELKAAGRDAMQQGDLAEANQLAAEQERLKREVAEIAGPGPMQRLEPEEVLRAFGMHPAHWRIEEGVITGKCGDIDRRVLVSKPFEARNVSFGFRIKAKWYHCIGVQLDGVRYFYSRGHWQNTGTLIHEGAKDARTRDRVSSAEAFFRMALRLSGDRLYWYYDGQLVAETKVPLRGKTRQIKLEFSSHETTVSLKDFLFHKE